MNEKTLATTSWVDGHKLEIRLVALLKKYGIKGTFYIGHKIMNLSTKIYYILKILSPSA